jgi:hypothetical protein
MNFTLAKWAETEDAILVHVYLDGLKLGTLALPKAAWAVIEARTKRLNFYAAVQVGA